MPIAFARALDMSCYVGGIGGLGYLIHTREVSEKFNSPLPPTPFWYVDDVFKSIELLCSAHSVEKLASTYSVPLSVFDNPVASSIVANCSLVLSAIKSKIDNGTIRKSPETERDKQLLSNISASVSAKGCLLDQVVNLGLGSNLKQWIDFLLSDGRLHVPVPMKTIFEN
jgi:hypothetical protein